MPYLWLDAIYLKQPAGGTAQRGATTDMRQCLAISTNVRHKSRQRHPEIRISVCA